MTQKYFRGLDVGTSRVVGAWHDDDGKIIIKSCRDCYIDIGDEDDFALQIGQLPVVKVEGRNVILGDDAIKIANWVKASVKRPMCQGVINPTDNTAMFVLEAIIKSVLGEPRCEGELCVVSVPANSLDNNLDTVVHTKALEVILTRLGYRFVPINEGYATLLTLNPKMLEEDQEVPYTGLAFSFGGGMTNACLAFRSKNLLQFSVARGGDYIDERVALVFSGVMPNQVTTFKEKYFAFNKEYTDQEIESFGFKGQDRISYFKKMLYSIAAYYDELIKYVCYNFAEQFTKQGLYIDNPMEIVIAGGTAIPPGMTERVSQIIKEKFPINVYNVRVASPQEMLYCTALGSKIWAQVLSSKEE